MIDLHSIYFLTLNTHGYPVPAPDYIGMEIYFIMYLMVLICIVHVNDYCKKLVKLYII
jgi:hypothetical protein